jgi:hypothetical protein
MASMITSGMSLQSCQQFFRVRLACEAAYLMLASTASRGLAVANGPASIVPCCGNHDKVEIGHHEWSLSAIAETANPTIEAWLAARAVFEIANVPLVAVATLLVDAHA